MAAKSRRDRAGPRPRGAPRRWPRGPRPARGVRGRPGAARPPRRRARRRRDPRGPRRLLERAISTPCSPSPTTASADLAARAPPRTAGDGRKPMAADLAGATRARGGPGSGRADDQLAHRLAAALRHGSLVAAGAVGERYSSPPRRRHAGPRSTAARRSSVAGSTTRAGAGGRPRRLLRLRRDPRAHRARPAAVGHQAAHPRRRASRRGQRGDRCATLARSPCSGS
jgi:hypothetical protein